MSFYIIKENSNIFLETSGSTWEEEMEWNGKK